MEIKDNHEEALIAGKAMVDLATSVSILSVYIILFINTFLAAGECRRHRRAD